jgi:Ca2+/H+ antiporter
VAVENPLRSEAAMFRVVIVVAVAALPVILVGLVAEPIYAAILLGLELIAGIVFLWRGLRNPRAPEEAAPEGEPPPP